VRKDEFGETGLLSVCLRFCDGCGQRNPPQATPTAPARVDLARSGRVTEPDDGKRKIFSPAKQVPSASGNVTRVCVSNSAQLMAETSVR
jgi:hypothetical protein